MVFLPITGISAIDFSLPLFLAPRIRGRAPIEDARVATQAALSFQVLWLAHDHRTGRCPRGGNLLSWSRIVPIRLASVGDVEALIHSRDQVKVHHQDFDGEIEKIKTNFGMVPRRIIRTPGVHKVRARAKSCAERAECSTQCQNPYFGSPGSSSKLFGSPRPWENLSHIYQQKREECEAKKICYGGLFDVKVDSQVVWIQGVMGVDDADDRRNQKEHRKTIYDDE